MSQHRIKIFENKTQAEEEIPLGKARSMMVKGKKICVSRTSEGIFAVDDRCPHNGASLSQGYCNEKNEIICPMHRYPFDLKSGKATSGLAMNLNTYPIEISDDGYYVLMKAKWWEM